MEIKTVAVIGAGVMGNGIAQLAAMAGVNVCFQKWKRNDQDMWLAGALKPVETSLDRIVKKGTLDEAGKKEILGRIHATHDLKEAVSNADYVIETIPEVLERKLKIFKEIDELAPAHAILSSNTSQFKITALASATSRPGSVVGTHFFNPPLMRRFVEVVRGMDTTDETLQVTRDLFHAWKMETIVCEKDSAGFITSRLLVAFINEAMRVHEEGLASAEDIDKAARLAFGHPMGPLELSDFSGLDTALNVRNNLSVIYGERYRPTQALANLVQAGHLGRKTGRGYYTYDKK